MEATDISKSQPLYLSPFDYWDPLKLILCLFIHIDPEPGGKWLSKRIDDFLPLSTPLFQKALVRLKHSRCNCPGATSHLGSALPLPTCARPLAMPQSHLGPHSSCDHILVPMETCGLVMSPETNEVACLYPVSKWVLFHVQYFFCLLWSLGFREAKGKAQRGQTENWNEGEGAREAIT